jgi:cell division protein FtsI/penicillin-binding protein 2
MGQEVGVTPVQMAAAFGALANDGMRIAPHLVREIRNSSGEIVYTANPNSVEWLVQKQQSLCVACWKE